MGIEATVIAVFGDDVSDDSLVKIELDDTLNKDSEGEVTTTFYVGDIVYFIVHLGPGLKITKIKTTDGTLTELGAVTRTRTQQMLFTDTDEALTFDYQPSSGYSAKWYGREATLSNSSRSLLATANVPALADISANISAYSYKLTPPTLDLDDDEKYPIVAVVYVDKE